MKGNFQDLHGYPMGPVCLKTAKVVTTQLPGFTYCVVTPSCSCGRLGTGRRRLKVNSVKGNFQDLHGYPINFQDLRIVC